MAVGDGDPRAVSGIVDVHDTVGKLASAGALLAERERRGVAAAVKDLDAVVGRVSYRDPGPVGGVGDRRGPQQLAGAVAARSERIVQGAVVRVEYADGAVARDGNALAVREGVGHAADRVDGKCVAAVGRVEDLYDAVVPVGECDGDPGAVGRVGDLPRPRVVAVRSERVVQGAVGRVKDLDAAVDVPGRGDPGAVRRPGRTLGALKVLVAVAARPPNVKGERAVGIEHLDAVGRRVGHREHSRHHWRRQLAGKARRRRPYEVPVAGAVRSKLEREGVVGRVKDLDAVAVAIGNGDQGAVDRVRRRRRPYEVPVAGAARSDALDMGAGGAEHLHAVVAGVGHRNMLTVGRPGRRQGRIQLPVAVAARSDALDMGAGGAEHLHAVVAGVGHRDSGAVWRVRRRARRIQLPVAVAVRSKLEGHGAVVRIENLDAVVAGIGHRDSGAVWRVRRRAGLVKLPVAVAVRAEHAVRRAVGIEHLHAVVAGVRYGDEVTVIRVRRRAGLVELPASAAVRSELADECAAGIEHLDAVVERVGHRKHAGRMHGRRQGRRKCD